MVNKDMTEKQPLDLQLEVWGMAKKRDSGNNSVKGQLL